MTKNNDLISTSSVRMGLLLFVGVVIILLIGAAVVGGSYLLSIHAVDVNTATQHALFLREQTAQLRAAIPTCHALAQISSDAQAILNLPGWSKAGPSVHPIISFFKDFRQVYNASNCDSVLAFARKIHQ